MKTTLGLLFVLIFASTTDALAPRSGGWPAVRAAYIVAHPTCEACGSKQALEVHHVLPVHFPGGKERELDPTNLLTLCRPDHLAIGHHGDWYDCNPDAKADAIAARVVRKPPAPVLVGDSRLERVVFVATTRAANASALASDLAIRSTRAFTRAFTRSTRASVRAEVRLSSGFTRSAIRSTRAFHRTFTSPRTNILRTAIPVAESPRPRTWSRRNPLQGLEQPCPQGRCPAQPVE